MKNTSYTQEIKEEILSKTYSENELRALLSGFIKANGNILSSSSFKPQSIVLRTENKNSAKQIINGLESIYGIQIQLFSSQKNNLNRKKIYTIKIDQKVEEILANLEVSDGIVPILPNELVKGKLLEYFLRGLFLALGTVNDPSSSNYHLQLAFSDEVFCDYILKLMNSRFKEQKKMSFKKITRKTKYVLYLKKSEQICVFLMVLGATQSRLKFENYRIERDFINSTNRCQICENANLFKTIKSSNEQLKTIEFIKSKSGFNVLDSKTKAVIEIREKNEEYTLKNISEALLKQYNIKLSKSGVNHIFKNIEKLAIKLKGQE